MPISPDRPRDLSGYRQPFRASVAIQAGLTTVAKLRGATWRQLFRDVYVDARTPVDHRLRVAGAALLLPPGAVFAGRSAAIVWGASDFWSVDDDGADVEVCSPRPFGPVAGLKVTLCTLRPEETVIFKRLLMTTSLRTAWDLARRLPLREAVPAIDSLARARRLSKAELMLEAGRHLGTPGSRIAARNLRQCDPLAESPPESLLRLDLQAAGFAVVPQFWIMSGGQFVARVDLALPEVMLAIEYDGQWHADHHQLGRDRARVRQLNQAGWQVFQVTKEDMRDIPRLMREIGEVVERLKGSWG